MSSFIINNITEFEGILSIIVYQDKICTLNIKYRNKFYSTRPRVFHRSMGTLQEIKLYISECVVEINENCSRLIFNHHPTMRAPTVFSIHELVLEGEEESKSPENAGGGYLIQEVRCDEEEKFSY